MISLINDDNDDADDDVFNCQCLKSRCLYVGLTFVLETVVLQHHLWLKTFHSINSLKQVVRLLVETRDSFARTAQIQ